MHATFQSSQLTSRINWALFATRRDHHLAPFLEVSYAMGEVIHGFKMRSKMGFDVIVEIASLRLNSKCVSKSSTVVILFCSKI